MNKVTKVFEDFKAKLRDNERILTNQNGEPVLDENGTPMVNRAFNRHVMVDSGHAGSDIGIGIGVDIGNSMNKGVELGIDHEGNAVVKQSSLPDALLKEFVGRPNTDTVHQELLDSLQKQVFSTANASESIRVSKDMVNQIPDEVLISSLFGRISKERILAEFMRALGKEPTNAAINRTIEFLNATCSPSLAYSRFEEYQDMDPKLYEDPDKMTVEQRVEYQLNMLVSEMNQLMFVSKARLIYCEYPETASISVQMVPSVFEDEELKMLQAFEDLVKSMKPAGLTELEISITNKVVY